MGRGLPYFGLALLALSGCAAGRTATRKAESPDSALGGAVPLITKASVVAFWLPAADTIVEVERTSARVAFRRSNAMVAHYLSDTDILLFAAVKDTVVIELAGGTRRIVMLSGLDYPYGYVLIEPGYAEEFHTGVTADEDLQAAIDDYFGLESDSPRPRHRIALHGHARVRMVSR